MGCSDENIDDDGCSVGGRGKSPMKEVGCSVGLVTGTDMGCSVGGRGKSPMKEVGCSEGFSAVKDVTRSVRIECLSAVIASIVTISVGIEVGMQLGIIVGVFVGLVVGAAVGIKWAVVVDVSNISTGGASDDGSPSRFVKPSDGYKCVLSVITSEAVQSIRS